MTWVEKLQEYIENNPDIIDIKFFPRYFMGVDMFPNDPPPDIEKMAECAYKLLTGEIESTEVDVSELDI